MRVLRIRRKRIYLQIYRHLSKCEESRGAICSHVENVINQKCSPSKDIFLRPCSSSRIKVKEGTGLRVLSFLSEQPDFLS